MRAETNGHLIGENFLECMTHTEANKVINVYMVEAFPNRLIDLCIPKDHFFSLTDLGSRPGSRNCGHCMRI